MEAYRGDVIAWKKGVNNSGRSTTAVAHYGDYFNNGKGKRDG